MQPSDCDVPGSPDSGSCFFNSAVWRRIWAKEKAAGSSQRTPSIAFEEAEFAVDGRNLTAAIADIRLMATSMSSIAGGWLLGHGSWHHLNCTVYNAADNRRR
jgi:hypothetical protein